MYSPWSNPLPLGKYTAKPVVVYYREGRHWIPIIYLDFSLALVLYKRALSQGEEIFIFPANCHPLKPGWKGELFSPVEASWVVSR